ncbi:CLUMA_CG014679, isoform A [Clunio marinus]|uniref:CLUMA_CG014679, isoform A n=1 Tax=Clunio marinus TaxID=568069 RepID=A0A1J1IMZ2_9DIPT|nr:CLUMA_CG014679, isoform A [Clunio marinus]
MFTICNKSMITHIVGSTHKKSYLIWQCSFLNRSTNFVNVTQQKPKKEFWISTVCETEKKRKNADCNCDVPYVFSQYFEMRNKLIKEKTPHIR